ncbi:uncharacterized protein A1O5_10906 [Cladophialophora psammophila CBS 110553]|uniref:Uncharacterized protein n=1 Tax=Cladophialophora psammophila CBS 110553 TaxID=1182543 RepID=W9WLR5_9EURO|nr:uncharacterized protein A1O5_10906 [Cladophialophora psammophila CBS 110553]EXJ65930.1 hypothetical protein A1O5_10906 [Cladophialophora psammophila CBS 110553]
MDAAEHDLDAKLYKASGILLSELQHKLPLLLYRPGTTPPRRRRRVLDSKCEDLRHLLDRFQEWPQLLDPSLSTLIQHLTDAFVGYLAESSDQYGPTERHGTAGVSPLPRAICKILYSFCKVRGYKVIIRLLNNEPKYLAPMLSTFRAWNTSSTGMTWEERYIMLLWLSHLILAPFELATMSVSNTVMVLPGDLGNLPGIAGDVTSLAFEQLESSSKEREAASVLLVRLTLRRDMLAYKLPVKLVNYATEKLLYDTDLVSLSPYKALGFLSLLYGVTNSGSDNEVAPYVENLLNSVLKIATAESSQFAATRDSAPARKWILKILRATLLHAISLSSTHPSLRPEKVNTMLEESIQYYLDALSDKDTPVRMAAAKALSVVTLKLDPDMSAEVVEAVLGCLEENILLEDPRSHKLVAINDKTTADTAGKKRVMSAVDPLRWHGLMLTLAHLLFRRSPPPKMLSKIIRALLLGLEFEQRSNVGTSVGVGVRDAACFGLWALARKYSTSDLDLVTFLEYAGASGAECQSVLQLIAVKLIISACLDPSGNIRRGSSAALQELIGRHPDMITNGISVVQVVDYHAVARLSRAMTEVAPEAAVLGSVYHRALLQALREWRGVCAVDVNQRRWAASTIQLLTRPLRISEISPFAEVVLRQLLDLKSVNIGSTAAARHGLLLGLASALDSFRELEPETALFWLQGEGNKALELKILTGKIEGRITSDIELVMEAIATLICGISKCCAMVKATPVPVLKSWISAAAGVLNHCTTAGTREIAVQTSAEAFVELFKVLPRSADAAMVEEWLDRKRQTSAASTSKGRLKTLSLVHGYLTRIGFSHGIRQRIVTYTMDIIQGPYKIETRVDAMDALGIILSSEIPKAGEGATTQLYNVFQYGLTDYTNDQRGDIGSILRLQTLETVDKYRIHLGPREQESTVWRDVLPLVVKLAAEKLTNVRFRAWKCLESYWQTDTSLPGLRNAFHYATDVSSVIYFQQMMELLCVPWAQKGLILGLVSSATSGAEDLCRAASNAFIWHMQCLEPKKQATVVETVSTIVVEELALRAKEDDRQVLPLLDFLCLIIDQNLYADEFISHSNNASLDLWAVMQKVHGPSSSLQRIEASLNVYSRMLAIDAYRARALDKLTRQLLHRWPKIRNIAADFLYVDYPSQKLAFCDWNEPLASIKPVVLEIRKQVGAAGMGGH